MRKNFTVTYLPSVYVNRCSLLDFSDERTRVDRCSVDKHKTFFSEITVCISMYFWHFCISTGRHSPMFCPWPSACLPVYCIFIYCIIFLGVYLDHRRRLLEMTMGARFQRVHPPKKHDAPFFPSPSYFPEFGAF